MKEETVKSVYVYRGKVINLKVDDVKITNGKLAVREVVEHRGAVAILAYKDGLVWLVKQFRYPYLEELLEIPAGKIEENENPYHTALRELNEEVGLITDKLIALGEIYPSPGFANEKIHLYYTVDFEVANNNPDDDEYLEIIKLPLSKALALIDKGEIKDAKTIIALLWFQRKVLNNGK